MPLASEQLSSAALAAASPPVSSAGGFSLPWVEDHDCVCQWINGRYVVADDWASLNG